MLGSNLIVSQNPWQSFVEPTLRPSLMDRKLRCHLCTLLSSILHTYSVCPCFMYKYPEKECVHLRTVSR